MKKIASVALTLELLACTPTQTQSLKSFGKTVLDVAQVACVIANAGLSDEDVAHICDVEKGLYTPMRSLLSSTRAAEAAKKAAGAARPVTCSGDEAHLQCSSSQ